MSSKVNKKEDLFGKSKNYLVEFCCRIEKDSYQFNVQAQTKKQKSLELCFDAVT